MDMQDFKKVSALVQRHEGLETAAKVLEALKPKLPEGRVECKIQTHSLTVDVKVAQAMLDAMIAEAKRSMDVIADELESYGVYQSDTDCK